MKVALFSIVFLGLAVVHCAAYYQPPPPQVFRYEQRLDHFNESDTRTFSQRYLIYNDYYNNVSSSMKPLFFTPGGEADVFGGYNHNGFMFQYGGPLGAFMLFPEHRFYGRSLPAGRKGSYQPDIIKFLTIEQALQDYYVIIDYVKAQFNLPDEMPLISVRHQSRYKTGVSLLMFGGSYPGELAAFMRIANPDMVWGSLASSAPVRYHPFLEGGTRPGAFYAVATHDFAAQNETCPGIVQNAFVAITEATTTSEIQNISEQLRLCQPFADTPAARRDVNLWIENAFATLGMENYPYAIGDYPAYPMKAACQDAIDADVSSDVERLAVAIGVVYNATKDLPCYDISAEYFPCADITGCGSPGPDAASWDYQSCTEIIADVDTNNVTDVFPAAPFNYTRLSEYCMATWGTIPQPLKIAREYNYTDATRIIFSNGLLDPWWPGGVHKPPNDQVDVILIPGAAHHLDLRGSDPADPQSVVSAREKESSIINSWIAAYYDQFS